MRRALPASVSYRLGASSGFLTSVFVLLNPSDNSVKRLLSELAFISRWALSLKVTILKRRTYKNICMLCLSARPGSWITREIVVVVSKSESFSPSGNWTPVSRVTGGDTNHYTNEELLINLLSNITSRWEKISPPTVTCRCENTQPVTPHIIHSGRLGLFSSLKTVNGLE